jgi:hypothetical protein
VPANQGFFAIPQVSTHLSPLRIISGPLFLDYFSCKTSLVYIFVSGGFYSSLFRISLAQLCTAMHSSAQDLWIYQALSELFLFLGLFQSFSDLFRYFQGCTHLCTLFLGYSWVATFKFFEVSLQISRAFQMLCCIFSSNQVISRPFRSRYL